MGSKMNTVPLATTLAGLTLVCSLCFMLAVPTFAAEQMEQRIAADYVQEQGIMAGDRNGDLNLSAALTRAELAVLTTRLCNGEEVLMANTDYYARGCRFNDVPEWAKLYVGYCVRRNLATGYDKLHFGAFDPVTPASACTVLLRARGIEDDYGSVWSYNTAVSYAASLGWIDRPADAAAAITRGDVAVLIYRAMTGSRPVAAQSTGTGEGYLTNGEPITEENVLELLHEVETDWPTGTVWGTHSTPGTHKNEVPSTAANQVMKHYRVSGTYACGGYASMVSSLVFGNDANPARQVTDLSQIRPGDILFLIRNDNGNLWHVMVALESPNDMNAFHCTDGNNGGQVYWPDPQSPYSRENLDCFGTEGKTYRIEAWTRYPENVPYTGESINAWSL